MCIMAATSTWLAFRGEHSLKKKKKKGTDLVQKNSQWKSEMHKQQDIPDSMPRRENKPGQKKKD